MQNPLDENRYIEALLEDLQNELPRVWGRRLVSIFMGGGTPSLFKGESLARLLQGIHQLIPFGPELEITMEANPGAIEHSQFESYLKAGINRLSLGIQSFLDPKLQTLGRVHNSLEAKAAITAAKSAGFTNFNLDLMYGLPGQSAEEAVSDVTTALSFEPTHLSWYQLTLEPNTQFAKYPPTLPEEQVLEQMEQQVYPLLENAGFSRYEVSAYARAGKFCRHNKNYWQFGDYLGIGAGAHGKCTAPDTGVVTRTQKLKLPAHYLDPNKPYLAFTQTIHADALAGEFMINALRLREPLLWKDFSERTGLLPSSISAPLETAKSKGLIEFNETELSVTPLGQRFLDELVGLFT